MPSRRAALVLVVAALSAGAAAAAAGPPPGVAFGLLTPRRVATAKAALAVAGAAFLALGALRVRAGRGSSAPRLRAAALLGLGLLGGLCGWNLLAFHYPGFAHPRDNFHYYMGAKYFRELGYARLYACTALADRAAGLRQGPRGGLLRNLETNRLEPAAAELAAPERCRSHFSPERWAAFERDLAWLRARLPARRWLEMQADHGYNATPAWGILPGLLTNAAPLSDRQILALTLLDPLLLLLAFGAVGWAFGGRVLCALLLFWGTNQFAPFDWVGGGILRQDWLAALLIGLALLRRGWPGAAGFLLGWAALLRLFPGFLLAGLALRALVRMARERRLVLAVEELRIALGGLLALAVALPLSALPTGSLRVWLDFAGRTRVMLATPLANHMGLATLLAHDPSGPAERALDASLDDPYAPWKEARQRRFASRRPLFALLVAAYLALLARAVAGLEAWEAAALGVGLVPVAAELTGYYYAVLAGLAPLALRRPMLGAALVALAALSWAIPEVWHYQDQISAAASAAVLALVLGTTLACARRPSPRPGA